MITRHFLRLTVFAMALASAPITLAGQALADDSEDINAPRQNWPQNGAFPNQGGWNQGNRNNCGNGVNCGQGYVRQKQMEQGRGEQERNNNPFMRNNRDGGGGGGGGDND